MNSKELKNAMQSSISTLREADLERISTKDYDPLWKEKIQKINLHIDDLSAKFSPAVETKSAKVVQKRTTDYVRKSLANLSTGSIGNSNFLKNTGDENATIVSGNASSKPQIASAQEQQTNIPSPQDAMQDLVYQGLMTVSAVRQICGRVAVSSDYFEIPMSINDINAEWSDGTTVAPISDNLVSNYIRTFPLTAQPLITQRMIDDSVIDLESWLKAQLVSLFAIKEDYAFLYGDGVNMPKGMLSYPTRTSNSGVPSIARTMASNVHFTEDDLLHLYYSLPEQYSPNSSFLMGKETVHCIRTMKDSSSGQYYWIPGMLFGKADTLLGMPLYTTGAMPGLVSGKDVIAYGDFSSAYLIVDKHDMVLQGDPFTAKPKIVVYAVKWVGGDLINTNAITSMRLP